MSDVKEHYDENRFISLTDTIIIMLFAAISSNAQTTTQWGPDGFVKIENGLAGLDSNIASGDILVKIATK